MSTENIINILVFAMELLNLQPFLLKAVLDAIVKLFVL